MMTVLAIGPADAIALVRVVLYALHQGLRVVLASDRHPLQSVVHPALVRVELPPISAAPGIDKANAEAIRVLRDIARAWRPNVVHVHGLGPYADLCRIARLQPFIISAWGFLNDLLTDPPTPVPEDTLRVLADSAAVLVESVGLERVIGAVVTPPTIIEPLRIGVDGNVFAPSTQARVRWRRALDIPEDGFLVVSPRGWEANYNQSVVFEAFRQARAAVSRPMFLVFLRLAREVVEGASAHEIRAMESTIEAAELGDAVRWLPPLRHVMMAGLFSAADVLVSIPSSDAMPSTLVEAAACELPFIVSDLPHYRGTFIERGGTRVAPKDPAALAAALIRHAREGTQRDGAALRSEVCAQFDPQASAQRLLDIYTRHREAPERPRPTVSVILTTYERPHLLVQALDSALAHSTADTEIIVVDDGSSPETQRVLAPYAGRVTLLRKVNGGPASARNAGLRVARGRFVAFLDDDDMWLPERLSALLPIFAADDSVDVVFADMRYVDANGVPMDRQTCFGDRPPPPGPLHPEMLFVCNVVPVGAVLVRYTAIAEVGFFDETLRTTDDYDLWFRLVERGPQAFRWVNQVVADYRQHSGNISVTAVDRMLLDVVRGREKAFDRNPRIRAMHPLILDRRLFDLYLFCGERALERGDRLTGQALLDRFRHRRSDTTRSLALAARMKVPDEGARSLP